MSRVRLNASTAPPVSLLTALALPAPQVSSIDGLSADALRAQLEGIPSTMQGVHSSRRLHSSPRARPHASAPEPRSCRPPKKNHQHAADMWPHVCLPHMRSDALPSE